MTERLKIFTGNANPELAGEIARFLGTNLGKTTIRRFSDGETFCEFHDSVRGFDCFVVQPTRPPKTWVAFTWLEW